MSLTVTITGAFTAPDKTKASAGRIEQDFLENVEALILRFAPNITGGSFAGDHNAATIGASGKVTWTSREV